MSTVTNIYITASIVEKGQEFPGDELLGFLNSKLEEWEPGFTQRQRFESLSDSDWQGGSKRYEWQMIGASFNNFGNLIDHLIDLIINGEWDDPENVVMVMQPQEGTTMVYRPVKWDRYV